MKSILNTINQLIRLDFENPELEARFRVDHFEKSLGRIRLTILMAAFLYALFGILDEAIIPEVRHEAWIIRYLVFCPLALVVYALSHLKAFHKFLEFSVLMLGLVAGAGIVVMIGLASPPGSDLYYAGLLLTCWFYYTFIRLRFLPATILSWGIFLLYEATAIWIKGTSSYILVNNSFFFAAFNITGMWACYSMERYARQDFLQRQTILDQTEKMRMIFDNSPVGILHFDDRGIITECNTSFEKLIGSPRERLIGLNMVADLRDDRVIQAVKQALAGCTGHCEGEYASVTAVKKTTATGNFVPVFGKEGMVAGGIGIIEDITDLEATLAALAESESRFKDLFENANDVIYTQDLQGNYTSANQGMTKTLGYSEEEFLKLNFRDIVEPAWMAATEENFLKKVRDGVDRTGPYEVVVRSKKGELVWLEIVSRLMRNNEEPVGIHGIARDISDRRRMELALRESEEKYRTVLEASPDPIVVYDEAGCVIYVNPAFVNTFGWSLPELVGKRIDYVPESESRQTMETINRLFDGKNVPSFETKRFTKDGRVLDIRISAALMRDAGGKPIGNVVTLLDITQEKLMDRALRASEEGNRLLIAGSPVGIGIVQDGKYAYVNPSLVKIMGCHAPEDIVNHSPLEFIAPEDRNATADRVAEILAGVDITANYRVRGMKKNGDRFEVSVWPLRTDYLGKPALLAFVLDITEETRLKAQLVHAQKMEAVGTLAGGLAHDFNNLLQVVLGYSGFLLGKNPPGSRQYDHLRKINSAARRGADLVKELLTFSRKTATSPCPLDLNSQVSQVRSLLERTIPKMIKIELRLGEDLSIIEADPNQLEQIILNLAVNARDAMPDGGVVAIETQNALLDSEYCKAHLGAKPGMYVMLSVSDTGQGMSKDVLEHIFEPFYTTKDVGKGTGLGLSMVYGIVKQHDGYISCESTPGKGTIFRIYFPAVAKEEHRKEEKNADVAPGGTETILVVDDEDSVRELAAEYLRESGYSVLTAPNGVEALSCFQQRCDEISLVILDLIMPDMGGKQCLQALLKSRPQAKVLIMSGQLSGGAASDVLELGAKDFIEKPYDMEQLLNKARKILDSD